MRGFRELQFGSLLGLIGQALIWGAVIALWIVGSLFGSVPVRTSISYGANGLVFSSGDVFALYYLLMLGALGALVSLVLLLRGFKRVGESTPRLDLGDTRQLAALGAVGFGMFAAGLAIWLGSFVPPGAGPSSDAYYTSVMGTSIPTFDALLLVFGGIFALIGIVGAGWGASKIGATYAESSMELGGVFVALPVLSVIGFSLSLLGADRGERKLTGGWTPPPPPPPPPVPPVVMYPGAYGAGASFAPQSPAGSWDSVAAVLIVLLVLTWLFILPFTLFFALSGTTHGPGGVGGNGGASSGPASPSANPVSSLIPLLVGLIATALIVPIAIARNKRKRQRSSGLPPPPPAPQPPPAPVLQVKKDDPLDHLV